MSLFVLFFAFSAMYPSLRLSLFLIDLNFIYLHLTDISFYSNATFTIAFLPISLALLLPHPPLLPSFVEPSLLPPVYPHGPSLRLLPLFTFSFRGSVVPFSPLQPAFFPPLTPSSHSSSHLLVFRSFFFITVFFSPSYHSYPLFGFSAISYFYFFKQSSFRSVY